MGPVVVFWLLASAQAGGISRVPSQTWSWPDVDDLAYMGSSAAIGDFDGDGRGDLAMGSGLVDSATLPNSGRVDVFYGSTAGFAATSDQTILGDVGSILLGYALVAADCNGDGFDDLVASTATVGVRVYYGSAEGLGAAPGIVLEGAAEPLAGAGDVNGDGADDLLVGDGTGGVTLYLGSASGFMTGMPLPDAADSAAGGLDVNGDGLDDVILGDASGEAGLGVVRVYFGSASGAPAAAPGSVVGPLERIGFGRVGAAGDLDGDGFGDVAVAATADAIGGDASGAVRVYRGSASGLDPEPSATLIGAYEGANLGWVMAGPADFDADGFADLTLGGRSGREVYVYPGSAAGLPVDPSDTVEYGASGVGAALGLAVGDVDDDGCDDLLVGGPGAEGAVATLYAGNCPDLDGDGISGPRDCDDEDPEVGACEGGVGLTGGCGCGTSGPAGPLWLGLIGLLALRRRR